MRKKKILIISSIILLIVGSSFAVYRYTVPEIPKDGKPILKIQYEGDSRHTYYVRLFENGVYEIYNGAFFLYPKQPFNLPLFFYDVKTRRLPKKDTQYIIGIMDIIKTTYESDIRLPNSIDGGYVMADIYGVRYVSEFYKSNDNGLGEMMYELYSTISNKVPKIWLYSGPLRMYDENGNIVPSGRFNPEEINTDSLQYQ